MMKSLLGTLACLFLLLTTAQAQHDDWLIYTKFTQWDDVLAMAQRKNKPILVDIFTDWCGPCKQMDREVFSQKHVYEFMGTHFFPVKANVTKEEGANWMLEQFKVDAYPTFLVFSPKGELMHKGVGARNEQDFLDLLERARKPASTWASLHRELTKQTPYAGTFHFMDLYLKACYDQATSADDLLVNYYESLPSAMQVSDSAQALLTAHIWDAEHPLFPKLVRDRRRLGEAWGEEKVTVWLQRACYQASQSLMHNPHAVIADALERLMPLADTLDCGHWLLPACIKKIAQEKSWEELPAVAERLLAVPPSHAWANTYNTAAWSLLTHHGETHASQALALATRATAILPSWSYLDTYATALYLNGQHEEAIRWQRIALAQMHEATEGPEAVAEISGRLQAMIDKQKLLLE